jgi:hypothetical protein
MSILTGLAALPSNEVLAAHVDAGTLSVSDVFDYMLANENAARARVGREPADRNIERILWNAASAMTTPIGCMWTYVTDTDYPAPMVKS